MFLTRGARIVQADEGCTVISGYTLDELIALPSVTDIVVPRERALIADRMRRRLAGEMLETHYESAILHKHGYEVPVEVAVRLADARDGRVLVFVRDISSRKHEERDLEDLFMNAPVAYHEIDMAGRITRVNDTELALLGYGRDELLGRPVWELAQDPELTRQSVLHRLQSLAPPPPTERMFQRKTGEPLWMLINSQHKRSAGGEVVGMRVILLDITRRKASDARLLEAQKMEAVGRLAGGIAHEFNNLLTIIMGYAQALTDTLPSGSGEAADAREIRSAAQRAADLTQQLLAFSRQQPAAITTLDLNHLVDSFAPIAARLAGAGIQVGTRLAPAPALVAADENQLRQVLLSLVLNARDAMPSGGTLTFAVTAGGDAPRGSGAPGRFHRVDVTDTGAGMSPEVRAHAFEPFFTTKPTGLGTGMGLATAYGLIQQAGGYAAVRSESGAGTTVSLWLPAASSNL